MTIGNIDFGLPSANKKEIFESGKFDLELIYSNGTDELEMEVKEIISVTTQSATGS